NLLVRKAVIAASYLSIHLSNLVIMGVLPLQIVNGENADDHSLDRSETFDIQIDENVEAGQVIDVIARKDNGEETKFQPKVRFDSEVEADYYRHGGILQLVLRNKIAA